MQVIWRDGMTKGDNEPMTVVAVKTTTGSLISADLVVALETVQAPRVPGMETVSTATDGAGLLEVIEAQMAEIDNLVKFTVDKDTHDAQTKDLANLQEWADQFPGLVENLCMALGLPRNPVGPTGIPELDVIVSLAR